MNQNTSSQGFQENISAPLTFFGYKIFFLQPIGQKCRGLRPIQHIIGHFGNDFYRPDNQTNSVKALKEISWSSRSGMNPTRTTPPCYNSNTTLGNSLYAQRKGPNVTNPICWTCKNCSCKCAADCEHCVMSSGHQVRS